MKEPISDYEQKAWNALVSAERAHRNSVRVRAGSKVADAVSSAGAAIKNIPGAEKVADGMDAAVKKALTSAAKAVFIPAIATVSVERRTRRLRNRHPEIGQGDPFALLDLQALDKGRPRQVIALANAVTSAGASIAITGAEVSTTVSGGATAGVVVAAIAADVGLSLAFLGRSVAEVAVHYGYDAAEPEEEIFLMGVLSYSTAASLNGKTAALAGLSRLSQQMMRRATWEQLNKDALVKVIQAVFTKIGMNLTHKRLAQLVPVVGGLISAGLSYDMQHRALSDATRVYRARFLAEKHGLAFDDWVKGATQEAENAEYFEGESNEQTVDVVAMVESVIDGQAETDADGLER